MGKLHNLSQKEKGYLAFSLRKGFRNYTTMNPWLLFASCAKTYLLEDSLYSNTVKLKK